MTTNLPNNFDFLIGDWTVANRKLVEPLSGRTEWEEFTGTSRCVGAFNGAANFDEISFPHRGSAGLTLRLYDPERDEWSLNWADSRTGRLDPPVVGRFDGDRGVFHGDDTYQGRPIRLRFIWSRVTTDSCRWEQAFSLDDGLSWEDNWVMDFTRR